MVINFQEIIWKITTNCILCVCVWIINYIFRHSLQLLNGRNDGQLKDKSPNALVLVLFCSAFNFRHYHCTIHQHGCVCVCVLDSLAIGEKNQHFNMELLMMLACLLVVITLCFIRKNNNQETHWTNETKRTNKSLKKVEKIKFFNK